MGFTKVPAAKSTAPVTAPAAGKPADAPVAAPAAVTSSTNVPPQPTLNGKPSTGPKGKAWLAQYGTTHNANGTPKAGQTGQAGKPAAPAPAPVAEPSAPSTVSGPTDNRPVNDRIKSGVAAATDTVKSAVAALPTPGSLKSGETNYNSVNDRFKSALGLKESEMTLAERMAYFTSKLDNLSRSSSKTSVQLNEVRAPANPFGPMVRSLGALPGTTSVVRLGRNTWTAVPGVPGSFTNGRQTITQAQLTARQNAAAARAATRAGAPAAPAAPAAPGTTAATTAAMPPSPSRMTAITQHFKNNPKKYAAAVAALGLGAGAVALYNYMQKKPTPPAPVTNPVTTPVPDIHQPYPGPAPAPAPAPDQGGTTGGPDSADIEKLNALARELENSNDPATVNLMSRYNHVINSINNGSPDDMSTYGDQATVRSSADARKENGIEENYEPNTDSSILEAIKRINRKYTNEGSIVDGVWTDKPPKPGQPNVPAPTDPEGVPSVKKPVVKKPTTTNTTVVKEFDESSAELERILHIMNHRR